MGSQTKRIRAEDEAFRNAVGQIARWHADNTKLSQVRRKKPTNSERGASRALPSEGFKAASADVLRTDRSSSVIRAQQVFHKAGTLDGRTPHRTDRANESHDKRRRSVPGQFSNAALNSSKKR